MADRSATPAAERVHIAFFGRRNAGKSSLVNALTGQSVAIVSPVAGTTTDPVRKSMELLPLGPVVMIDTPGLDDEGDDVYQRQGFYPMEGGVAIYTSGDLSFYNDLGGLERSMYAPEAYAVLSGGVDAVIVYEPTTQSVTSVSYTHLDGDKRQLVGGGSGHAAARRAHDETQLQKVRLVHVLDGGGVLAGGGGQRVKPHRAAAEFFDHRAQKRAVGVVEAQFVHFQHLQRPARHIEGDLSPALHLGKIAHAAHEAVGDARRAPRAAGDLQSALRVAGDLEDLRRAQHDHGQLLRRVQLQPEVDAEAVAQRRSAHARARGCADERELWKVQADGARRGALDDHDVKGKVLHRRVEHLLHGVAEAVDLVDEEHVPGAQVGEYGSQVAGALNGGAAGDAYVCLLYTSRCV